MWIAGVDGGPAELVFSTTTVLLEAPNWAPDAHAPLLNGDGLLWRLDLRPPAALEQVALHGVPPINNDHVIDAGRRLIYLSANDGHIWVAALAGGTPTRVTHDASRYHFLHGPDGKTLAFVDLPAGDFSAAGRLALISSAGGETRYPEAGSRHLDGPEYSPDGAWLYVNTEEFGVRPGHAQLARVPADGGRLEKLVASDTVDWFPHISPDGELATYVSFPTRTLGHPADLDVEVRLVRTSDWSEPIGRYPLFGGQGTINVNSWSPDSRRFAFMAYPFDAEDTAYVSWHGKRAGGKARLSPDQRSTFPPRRAAECRAGRSPTTEAAPCGCSSWLRQRFLQRHLELHARSATVRTGGHV